MKQIHMLLLWAVLLAVAVHPTVSMSRWFTSSFHDLKSTMKRYAHCMGDLQPLKDAQHNETDYLVNQITVFLKQGSYDNEQYANVTALMNDICQINANQTYAVSVSIDVDKYTNATGKSNRCRAIDAALDSMFHVFRKSAMNKSEPLDFSSIKFKADKGGSDSFYNLTDLINTSWIRSETVLEHVCNITDSIKEFVRVQTRNSTAQDRSQPSNSGYLVSLVEFLDRLLDPIVGFQRRLYLESTNRIQMIYYSVGNGLSTISTGVRKGVREASQRVYHFVLPSANHTSATNNATTHVKTNLTPTNLTQNK